MNAAEEIAPPPPAAAAPVCTEPSPVVSRILGDLSRRVLALAWLTGAGRILALLLALGVARCLFDLWVQLDWVVRLVFLVIDLAIAGWLARRLLWRPWKNRLSIERAALLLERVFPALGSRLIAAVQLPRQLTRGNVSAELVSVVVRDADATLAALPWREAAPAKPAQRALGVLFAVFVVAGGLFALNPQNAAVLARRWLLSTEPAVTRTRLALAQGDLRIALGAPVTLAATATGVVPRQAVLEIDPADGEPRTFTVSATDAAPGAYSLTIENVRKAFRYRVRAGDARSPWHDVDALPAPTLVEPRFTVRPPAYTKLPETRVEPGMEIVAPAGSELLVEGASSLPITSAALALWPDAQAKDAAATIPLTLGADGKKISGRVVLNAAVRGVTLPLAGANGVASQDDTRHPVRFVPDAAPVVELTVAPADDESATATSVVPITGRVSDDYGVSRLVLRWETSVADGAASPGEREIVLSEANAARADFSLKLAPGVAPAEAADAIALSAPAGATVKWWLELADNAPDPGVFGSVPRTLRVVTADEKLAEMMSRLRDGMGELDDVSRSLERVNESLGRLLPGDAAPSATPTPPAP